MEFNPSKTKLVTCTYTTQYSTGDCQLCKYLGLNISSKLFWNNHVDSITKRATCSPWNIIFSNKDLVGVQCWRIRSVSDAVARPAIRAGCQAISVCELWLLFEPTVKQYQRWTAATWHHQDCRHTLMTSLVHVLLAPSILASAAAECSLRLATSSVWCSM